MDKEKILDLILDIDLLYKYAEFIPNSYKSTYNQSLNNIKIQIKALNNLSQDNINKSEIINNNVSQESKSITLEDNYTNMFETVLDNILITDNNNETLSLKILLENSNKNFLDFIEHVQDLESSKEIKISKSNNDIPSRGWIKTGEILINSGLINIESLEQSIQNQNNRADLFLGESMIELKLLNENNLRKALKAQRWLFKICEEISK